MARHDDEQHAQRHDDDVAVLQNEVGHVDRLEQRAVGGELEEYHDDQQRQQQGVVADIGLDETENLRPGRWPCWLYLSCHLSHDFMIARMIFSCVASLAGISATKRPLFIT